MARGFTSRALSHGVSRHTVPERPLPTAADFSAAVYDQEWAFTEARAATTTFAVLGLDADHAREVGLRRLARMYPDSPPLLAYMVLTKNDPRPWADAESLANQLGIETTEDWQERQDRFKAFGVAS